jgi:hypothetical protein
MRRWLIPALVLGLHLLLFLGLQWGLRRASEKPLALPARSEFFLPPLARQRPPKTAKNDAKPPAKISRPNDAIVQAAQPDDPTQPTVNMAPSRPAPAAADPPRARLILTLPPLAASAPRNPAFSDPRSNTARQTLEEKMAQALDNTVHDQLQADGTTLRRRVGNDCVDLHESRAVQLMPDVDFLRFAPRASGKTYKCK